MRRLVSLLTIVLICGCARQFKVTVDPELYVNPSTVGEGRSVGLKVEDRRADKVIGSGGSRFIKFDKFEILSDANIAETIQDKVKRGLKELRFRPKPFADEKKRLIRVEILKIKNSFSEKISNVEEQMRVAMRVSCRNKEGGTTYANIYTAGKEERHPVLGAKFPNEKLINLTLSLALQNMFDDPKLIACLAQ